MLIDNKQARTEEPIRTVWDFISQKCAAVPGRTMPIIATAGCKYCNCYDEAIASVIDQIR